METKFTGDFKKFQNILSTIALTKGASLAYKNNKTGKWESEKVSIGKGLDIFVGWGYSNYGLRPDGKWENTDRYFSERILDESKMKTLFENISSREQWLRLIWKIEIYNDKIKEMSKKPSVFTFSDQRLSSEIVEKQGGFKLFFDPSTVNPALNNLGVTPIYKEGFSSGTTGYLTFQALVDFGPQNRVEITPTP